MKCFLKWGDTAKAVVCSIVIVTVVFCINSAIGRIGSPSSLAKELASPREELQRWAIAEKMPIRYRAAFRILVKGTYKLLASDSNPELFRWIFIGYSYLFFLLMFAALYLLLRRLDIGPSWAAAASIATGLLPPVTFAYCFPVHTREDPAAYFLVVLGISAVLANKPIAALVISSAAALVRETTLVISAFFLWVDRRKRWRFLAVVIPFGIVVAVRTAMTWESYNPFHGFAYNVAHPLESAMFLVLTFSFMWPAGFQTFFILRSHRKKLNEPLRSIVETFPVIFMLIFTTTISMARIREIRLIFLFFPWMVPLFAVWLRANTSELKHLLKSTKSKIAAFLLFAALLCAAYLIAPFYEDAVWVYVFAVHAFIFIGVCAVLRGSKQRILSSLNIPIVKRSPMVRLNRSGNKVVSSFVNK